MNRLRAFGLLLLLCANVNAQLVSVEPVAASSVTSGNEVGNFKGTPQYSPSSAAYTDSADYFVVDNGDEIPTAFYGHKVIRTKYADRGSTGASGVVEFTPDRDIQYCVWQCDCVTGKPAWLTSLQDTGQDIVVDWGQQSTFSAFCAVAPANVAVSLGGNTTDAHVSDPMYIVTFTNASFGAANVSGVGPSPDNGEYQFTSSGVSILESQTITVGSVERVNGFDGATSVDITDGGTGTCTSGSDYDAITDETISWADGVGGDGGGVSITVNEPSTTPCTIILSFTNATGSIGSSGVQQTHTVTVNAPSSLAAFPGCEGWGCDITHGRGGTVCIVTNLNNTGAGSLRNCLEASGPRIVIFRVSGTISPASSYRIGAAYSNVYVAGQTAPGEGIAIRSPTDDKQIIRFSDTGNFSNGLFRGLRLRHGAQGTKYSVHDNVTIAAGTNNVVFDHNSFTWANDEAVSAWGGNIYNITFSHNIFGAGVQTCVPFPGQAQGHNLGPLWSGGNPQYNFTLHHNLTLHVCYRAFYHGSGSGAVGRGYQNINNVYYNVSQLFHNFSQTGYSGATAIRADSINEYFKAGPWGPNVFPYEMIKAGGSTPATSLYAVGNTWRTSTGASHPNNNESDNYAWVQVRSGASWVERASPLEDQPANAVTSTTAAQAFTDIVTNGDVGALPHDSHDTQYLSDAANGTGWGSITSPSPWGAGSWPTLDQCNVPTDTDSDGVPDAYETSPLGTNPSVFEEQAQLDHDADGYSNIEEWIESLTPAACP